MKRTNGFTIASLSPKGSSGIAILICAAYASQPAWATTASVTAAQRVLGQRAITLAQVTEPGPRQAAAISPSARQEFANLGQLLDAGGKLMSPQQFKEEVAQHVLAGVISSGAAIEVMYSSSGMIAGNLLSGGSGQASGGGSNFGRTVGAPQNWPVSGSWTIDDSERICASMQINYAQGASLIPTRCQFWFKLGGAYYVCDSDEDRSAKIFVRVMKQ